MSKKAKLLKYHTTDIIISLDWKTGLSTNMNKSLKLQLRVCVDIPCAIVFMRLVGAHRNASEIYLERCGFSKIDNTYK